MNNRREVLQFGALATLIGIVGGFVTSCRENVVNWAGVVVSAFEQALPILQDILPGSVATITKALAVARDLQAALKAGNANAVDFIEQLIAPEGLFNDILNDIGAIRDDNQRRIIQGILLLAGVGLRLISTALQQGAPQLPPDILSKAKGKPGVGSIEKAAKSGAFDRMVKEVKF